MKIILFLLMFVNFGCCAQDICLEYVPHQRGMSFHIIVCTESKTFSLMHFPGFPKMPSQPFVGRYTTHNDTSIVYNHDSTAKVIFTVTDSMLYILQGYQSLYGSYTLYRKDTRKENEYVPSVRLGTIDNKLRQKSRRSVGLCSSYANYIKSGTEVFTNINFNKDSCHIFFRGTLLIAGKYVYDQGKVTIYNSLGKNIVFYVIEDSLITNNQLYFHKSKVIKFKKCEDCVDVIKKDFRSLR